MSVAIRTEQQSTEILSFADTIWRRNRQTEVVNFTLDGQNRLVGRVDHPAETLDAAELFFYLTRLAVECDRMEYLLTGENRCLECIQQLDVRVTCGWGACECAVPSKL